MKTRVCRYTCSNCNFTCYGNTYRHFLTSAAEHICVSNLAEKTVKNTKPSAVSGYLLDYDCSIDFGNFLILAADALNQRVSLGKAV